MKIIYNKGSIINALTSVNSGAETNARVGQYAIKISSPSLGNIAGILKEGISFSVDASWSTLGLENIIDSIMASNPIIDGIDRVLDTINLASGSSFTNTGIFSKLFYKNSGRLSISPSFRIFDFDGSGICSKSVTVLSALCVPKVGEKSSVSLEKTTEIIKNAALSANNVLKPVLGGIADNNAQNITKAAKAIEGSTANWSTAPDPVKIQIGSWLVIDQAVVQNVSFNFSYECTDAGPMWVDVGMKLDSIENLYIDTGGGLSQVKIGDMRSKQRVTISNLNENTNTDYSRLS